MSHQLEAPRGAVTGARTPWRRSLNETLVRLTGYEVRRAITESERAAMAAQRRRRARRQAKYALHRDFDDAAKDIIQTVRHRTMTSSDKLYGLITAVRYVVEHDIPGDVVECGVWRGGSMQAAAMALLQAGSTSRHLHLFDTFEGMPPPSPVDRRQDGTSAAELLATTERTGPVWAVAGLEDVRQAMDETAYPTDKIHYVQGMVEETVPSQAPERISILRLDTDWYESTRHELAHLYPRLSSGGVLIIDDYGYWLGARKATEEFLAETGARLLLTRISGGRLAVKP